MTLPRIDGSWLSKFTIREMGGTQSRINIVLGDFNPGIQPRGTPITAEAVHGGGVDINVTWRDAYGRAVRSSWSKSLGWDLPNGESELLDGRD